MGRRAAAGLAAGGGGGAELARAGSVAAAPLVASADRRGGFERELALCRRRNRWRRQRGHCCSDPAGRLAGGLGAAVGPPPPQAKRACVGLPNRQNKLVLKSALGTGGPATRSCVGKGRLFGKAGDEEEERDHPDAHDEGDDGAGAKAQGNSGQQVGFEAEALVVKQVLQVCVRKIGKPQDFVYECSNCK